MKAGASVDILGSIDADGKTYSFVAVRARRSKGLCRRGAMLDEMAEDAALAVDTYRAGYPRPSRSTRPTFTIAMNDGSLIYGELYPERKRRRAWATLFPSPTAKLL